MSPTSIIVLCFLASMALLATSTFTDALAGVARAGLLGPRTFVKIGVPAVLLTALACLFGPAQHGIVYFLAMASAATLSNATYVMVMAEMYGLDQKLAESRRAVYELSRNVTPLDEWKDPVALQAYLDAKYGRGTVNAKEMLARKRRSNDGDNAAQPA